jgi:hypothetical protein
MAALNQTPHLRLRGYHHDTARPLVGKIIIIDERALRDVVVGGLSPDATTASTS